MTTIKLKNGSGAPLAGDLVQGEPALDLTNKRLYTEDSGGTVIEVGTNPGEDVTFADNRKAIFGAGSDLQIYHDGSNSYIQENGTGDLLVGATNFQLKSGDYGESMLTATDDGAVTLFYNNASKLATTNTGIDVTGTVTADSLGIGTSLPNATLQVQGPVDTATISTSSTPAARINNGGAISNWIGANGYNYGYIQSIQDDGTNNLKPLALQPLGGNVGIGTSSPSATLALDKNTTSQHRALDLENNSITYSMYVDQDNSITNSWSLFDTTNSQTALRYLPSSSGYWQFYTNNTERMRIDGSGNVGIGVVPASSSSPTWQHIQFGGTGNLVARKADNGVDAMFASNYYVNASEQDTYITTGAAARMFINDNVITFDQAASGTAGSVISFSEAMRIDSSGNVLVGKTSLYSTDQGIHLDPDGTVYSTRPNNASGVFNRKNSDGNIVVFEKDGATVGSIGVLASHPFFVSTSRGIRVTNGEVLPCTSTGLTSDNTMDLGSVNGRFKDLYLSGGAYLGGTGSANKLDDYEEGTFTPFIYGTTAGTGTYTLQSGKYTKVGNLVHVQITIGYSAHTGSGNIQIGGLPFAAVSTIAGQSGLSIHYNNGLAHTAGTTVGIYIAQSSTIGVFTESNASGALAGVAFDTAVHELILSGTYHTAA